MFIEFRFIGPIMSNLLGGKNYISNIHFVAFETLLPGAAATLAPSPPSTPLCILVVVAGRDVLFATHWYRFSCFRHSDSFKTQCQLDSNRDPRGSGRALKHTYPVVPAGVLVILLGTNIMKFTANISIHIKCHKVRYGPDVACSELGFKFRID
jgi:hypothetical protein